VVLNGREVSWDLTAKRGEVYGTKSIKDTVVRGKKKKQEEYQDEISASFRGGRGKIETNNNGRRGGGDESGSREGEK